MPILTVASVRKYAAAKARREIADARAPGLYLVVQPKPSGAKSWALRFRRPDGRSAKLTLGRVDLMDYETKDEPAVGGALTLRQARQLATMIDRERARGIDVIEERKAQRARQQASAADRAANNFGACVREFFVDYKTRRGHRPRRWHEDAATLGLRYPLNCDPATNDPEVVKGGLVDIWADKPVQDIDGHDVHAVISDARKRGGDGRARKRYAALSVLFSWALRERRVAANPCVGIWRPGPPPARERVLTDLEIVSFWHGCGAIGAPFGALFQFMLLTGCRLREAADMTRAEVTGGVWTVSGSRTKNGRTLTQVLPTLAQEIVASVPVIQNSEGLVFTTNGRTAVSGFSKAKVQLDAAMAHHAGRAIAPWRLHDLRRTAVTGLAALGVQLPVIERIVNHVSGSFGGVAGVYQRHEFADEKREALARWAQHVQGLVSGRANVVKLNRGAR
jgi:integrase